MGARRRIFFALWPDGPTLERLANQAALVHGASGGRLMRAETLHLTLCFLGDVEAARVADACDAAAQTGSLPGFGFDLDQLGCFERARVLWAGSSHWPDALADLAAALAAATEKAGFRIEARPFLPHVTLVRDPVAPPPEAPWSPLRWEAREFVLVESIRRPAVAHYETLARWPLRAPTA
ncbi:RNA 2',3'-cyclic phosphodiesterase [Niveibacterium sp. SC-1]|uniref:RNA 2',3'-cyclic phosphodiesterase n=1 Tax=Niveibacterium sp. SC-1 TaxID=3135646 RepID=UPI00311DE0D1